MRHWHDRPLQSILGRRLDRVLETTMTFNPTSFDVADGDVRLLGTIVEIDEADGPSQRDRAARADRGSRRAVSQYDPARLDLSYCSRLHGSTSRHDG